MTDENTETGADQAPPPTTDTTPAKLRAPQALIDAQAGTVTRDGHAYRLDALPSDVQRHLALVGLRYELVTGRSFEDLIAGVTSNRRTASPKVDHWHEARALAIVEKTKKSASPQTIEQARAAAAEYTADEKRMSKLDAVVVKHYSKISGAISVVDAKLNGHTASAEAA